MNSGTQEATVAMAMRSPFTVSQLQELKQQAMIYKYMMAGLPVPPDLVLHIQKSFESISHNSRFFHHPAMGYYAFYGKKMDPEPGRCRRTDGKKWRCSKDAYPDSKYCERHMHRGRHRSRKPVESQSLTQSSPTVVSGVSVGAGSFQNLPLNSFGNLQVSSAGTNRTNVDSIPFGIPTKDYSYLQGLHKPETGEQSSFFTENPGRNGGLYMDTAVDNNSSWPLMSSAASYLSPKSIDSPTMQPDYSHHAFLGSNFMPVKQEEAHSLRPFFDEWPKSRDSWSGLDGERSNQNSFSTTQLSISIPMSSSDFSATSSRSSTG